MKYFYGRYPRWSLLGKMVEDTLAAVEALQATESVDPRRIYLLGYGPGAMVALHAAALDQRIAGVVSVAGFTPMRTDRSEKSSGGIARWCGWLPLQPRLGAFIGHESRIPYDYDEVLALIAPRPAIVFAPQIDYRTDLNDVRRCIAEAGKVYDQFGAGSSLGYTELQDYNRFSPEIQKVVFERLAKLASKRD
jgi:pimeloyl-ACP methyl ester carboxylesterase